MCYADIDVLLLNNTANGFSLNKEETILTLKYLDPVERLDVAPLFNLSDNQVFETEDCPRLEQLVQRHKCKAACGEKFVKSQNSTVCGMLWYVSLLVFLIKLSGNTWNESLGFGLTILCLIGIGAFFQLQLEEQTLVFIILVSLAGIPQMQLIMREEIGMFTTATLLTESFIVFILTIMIPLLFYSQECISGREFIFQSLLPIGHFCGLQLCHLLSWKEHQTLKRIECILKRKE